MGKGPFKTAAKINGDFYDGRSTYHLAMLVSLFRCVLNNYNGSFEQRTGHPHIRNTASIASFAPGMLFALRRTVRTITLLLFLAAIGSRSWGQQTPPRYFESYSASRQETDTPSVNVKGQGRVVVHADPKVERLMEQYGTTKHAQHGFRVQIYLGSERKAAEDMKRMYLQKNPESAAYQSWLAPNWRLRVGDLRTRLEAERLLRDLKPIYPGCYIVPDEIEMPRVGN